MHCQRLRELDVTYVQQLGALACQQFTYTWFRGAYSRYLRMLLCNMPLDMHPSSSSAYGVKSIVPHFWPSESKIGKKQIEIVLRDAKELREWHPVPTESHNPLISDRILMCRDGGVA